MTLNEKQKKLLKAYGLKVGDVIDFCFIDIDENRDFKKRQERLQVVLDDNLYYLKEEGKNLFWAIDKLVYHDWKKVKENDK